ncbi:fatty acid hydroxylase [Auriculariales sp. MPI-PUGE-AT-0066]|nr:fatty acid hydroxylase [Auriculariales sp. MPI-PUGE-AT-0066]
MASQYVPIPQPAGWPLIGNLLEIDPELSVLDFERLGKRYGEIFTINILGTQLNFVCSAALAAEVCDEKRFHKQVQGTILEGLRPLVQDALFTAFHGEENWGVAHRILMPAFGPASILQMFDDMNDILSQMLVKWDRFGPKHIITPADDFTRLAFDTVAYCTMSHRLNSFYTENQPVFVDAMGDWLTESGRRFQRPKVVQTFMRETNAKYAADMNIMRELAREIVAERRAHPNDRKDLLNAMVLGRDPQTGKGLTDKSIEEQMITFLIAGHETTSGLLSFLLYYVLKNPNVYAKLQQEIDTVVGKDPLRPEHLKRTPYIVATMREALRLGSPIPGFAVTCDENQVVAGKYLMKAGTPCIVLGYNISRDCNAYGDDVEEFKPERMMDGKFEKLPPKAWLPFGNGMRGCIGRGFAMQEAQMAVISMFQRFEFRMADPQYTLQIKQTLTLKPKDFHVYAIPRNTDIPVSLSLPLPTLATALRQGGSAPATQKTSSLVVEGSVKQKAYFFYGSNSGSCEMFAQRLANAAGSQGFKAEITTLDSVTGKLPTDGPVIIVTASFEGEPPDNAVHFVRYLRELSDPKSLDGVRYSVFGCGHKDWVNTYQKVPKFVDAALAKLGADRLLRRGETDAGGENFFEDFDIWEAELWPKLVAEYNVSVDAETAQAGLNIVLSSATARASQLRQSDAQLGSVVDNRLLTQSGAIEKRHIEIKLPEGVSYRAGDYLAILPTNPKESVERVMKRFDLLPDQQLTISSTSASTLPLDRSVSVFDLFSGYVELGQPATRRDIETLHKLAPDDGPTATALEAMLADYSAAVMIKRISIVSILTSYADINLPLHKFLEMLPAMRIRQYSISSSPLWNPNHVTLTLAVLRAASLANPDELFQGVGSTYLEGLTPGARVQVAVRASSAAFHLPADPSTQVVMFACGSGMAPMRGFIQERAAQKAAGRQVGKMLLFFGCRNPELDYLYRDAELGQWVQQDVVDVRTAFSRASEKSEGCKYVQDRIWHDRADVIQAFNSGARFYTCGSTKAASGIKAAIMKMLEEQGGKSSAEEAWAQIQNERYAVDVFG